ncbi:glycosyltransferase [bacterium]|nr:glycosyltransferase [bacterium]
MSEPDFTIVTASYNYGRFIGECLESVALQEGVSCEHLIMDAGSSDETSEVVSKFPHATFFQEPDRGMTDGINKGFRRAKGKWVMWLNADDRLKAGALKKVLEFAKKQSSADVIYGDWDFVNVDGEFTRRMTLFPFQLRMLIYCGCYIGSTSCFYRRQTVIDEGHLLDLDFHYCMDGEYYARLGVVGKKFEYLPEVLADFRLHDESISQRNLGSQNMGGIVRAQKQFAEPRAIRRFYGKGVGSEHFRCVVDFFVHLAYRVKRQILRKWYARNR